MQLTVKTLKGEKFTINVEEKNTITEVKAIIENEKSELPAASMRLILAGKILKNEQTVADCNLKPSTFLVVMITKAKKAVQAKKPPSEEKKPAAAAAADPTPTASVPVPASPAPAASNAPVSTPATTSATSTDVTPSSEDIGTATSSSITAPSAPASSNDLPPEAIANLMAMGFPEAEVKACLRAAQGNADVAVEFLMNGIPDYAHQVNNSASINSPSPGSGQNNTSTGAPATTEPLAQLRNHAQINQLRRLVQGNPGTLQAVLTQIGEQQPELLREINNNQELFLQIMNEPVIDDNNVERATSSTSNNNNSTSTQNSSAGTPSSQGFSESPEDMMSGMGGDPSQMAHMIDNMSPEHLQSMSSMMGLTPEQLRMTAAAVSRMPPEELQNYMRLAMQAGGGLPGGLGGMMGGGGGEGGRNPPGSQVLRLTSEEMAAVDRLAGMGFDRSEAAQAYIACDKNEELAANLLMDGGFGFQDDSMGRGPGGTGHDGNGGGSGGDMYD